MDKKINVLITGSGSIIGFGAIKLIRTYSFINKLIAGNTTANFPAKALTKYTVVYPDFYFSKKANEEVFINFILNLCIENKIHAIIPCSIFELKAFSRNLNLFEKKNIKVIVEKINILNAFTDKLKTIEFITQNIGDNYPETEAIKNNGIIPNIKFPFIIKPRYGYGSKAVSLISKKEEYQVWNKSKSEKFTSYIAQEFIPNIKGEYSCSVLFDEKNLPFSICAVKRKLKNGDTIMATYDTECKSIEKQIIPIAEKIKGSYCLNFQFRFKENSPIIFEINPRFAASEAIRAKFGQDPYYEILSRIFNIPTKNQKRKYGKIIRVYDEIFLPL